MYELIRHVKKAEATSEKIKQKRSEEIENQSRGFSGFFKALFGLIESCNDEFTMEERNKVPVYLSLSLQQLCNMFNISEVRCFI